ncbi:MAG: (2Fe-2S)-binding protein [Solirubrobacteraceae bacterium]
MVELEVNGTAYRVEAEPGTPLLYVLRGDLGLVATRFGCGASMCGACFVLVDGRAVASCDLPLWQVANASVTTVEGLAAESGCELSPLQQAFLDEQAAQCGYCVSGMLITATALLARNPAPTEDEVRSALDGNLCRCGSHNRIVRAVLRAVKS